MDLLEATESELKRKVGREDCTFSLLTAYDRANLLRADLEERRAAHKAQREELLANLKAAEITGAQAFEELESFRERTPQTATETDWIVFVNDPTKEMQLYAASLKPTHGDRSEELAKRARLSLIDKAAICGLSIVTPKDEETPDPNPQTAIPTSYGTPGIASTGSPPDA
jgi:hypothetical protein